MPKKTAPLEFNTFVAGLVTDVTPLTFPENASLDEDNMVLNTEGDRQRRLGMDYESDWTEITSDATNVANLAHTTYRWENAGGDAFKTILCVQFGNEVRFFDMDGSTISDNFISKHTESLADPTDKFSYAVVDGILVICNGSKHIDSFEYDSSSNTITNTEVTLRIRDLFSVEDIVDNEDLFEGNNVNIRPTTKTDNHIYNLRNQGWGVPRIEANTETLQDPIQSFFNETSSYPSNSDTVTQALYPDANDTDNRLVDRFFPGDLEALTQGSTEAPKGHFIINALERGVSRREQLTKMEDRYSSVSFLSVSTLPDDTTPGGPSVVSEFAGRVFYAGFKGEVTDGDDNSPRMSSYILFSRNVRDITDIGRCYQIGDPTSRDDPDIVDTDGGFVRIDEAYGIKAMINSSGSLFVFATNGVWRLVGNEDSGFTATGFLVEKLSERGILGSATIVEAEGAMVYWGDDGIYRVSRNQFGDWAVVSLSRNKIDSFYHDISSISKENAQGFYDPFDKKVRWVFNNSLDSDDNVRELVLDAELGSFYLNTIYTPSGTIYPKIVGLFETEPFNTTTTLETVVVGSDTVQVSGEDVTVGNTSRQSVIRSIKYIAVTEISPNIKYSFSLYKNTDFYDWKSVDGTGVDAAAYMITGYISGGDFQRHKQIPIMTTYFRKTESGFEEDVNGDLTPLNPSSCLVQTRWDWVNTADSNRFGTQFQAYRPNRVFFPEDVNDQYEDGHTIVVNKHKLRGRGRVLSIKFSTEPGKDLHLYGWSMMATVETNV